MAGSDNNFMLRALERAAAALFRSSPNPRVGCVLVSPTGQVIGEGSTQAAGSAHAEVMALRDAASRGHATQGATAYVTLEPCSHQGRTGPCCDALREAGIARVVAATADPNPLVAGRGIERLRAAGVDVQVGPCAAQARELNLGFFSRMQRGQPWVRLKAATSLDGATALANGASQWITSAQARADGHAWRARACAVLTGIGTVLEDDPRLDVREVATPRQPRLVVLDSHLRTPPGARLLGVPDREVLIATTNAAFASPQRARLEERGAMVVPLPAHEDQVDLTALLRMLADRGVNELHVEAGARLNGALLRQGLVDELLLYLAPKLLGSGARGLSDWGPLDTLAQGVELQLREVAQVGPDLRLLARVAGRDEF